MATLTISGFSCLTEAIFELSPINVIIGPQGSGKSVTTKLFYFFSDIITNFASSCERGDDFDQYKRLMSKQFNVWFPPSAWGNERFNITYTANCFSVRILRRQSRGTPSDEVSIKFSDWFSNTYKEVRELFDRETPDPELDLAQDRPVRDTFDRLWRLRDLVARRLQKDLGSDYLSQQTFIPAGRGFFTSIGRLVAGLEHAGSLDPVTIKFARLFATLRDRGQSRTLIGSPSNEFTKRRREFMTRLFGGEIKYENDIEFVETEDGRKIPFTFLSSGQQELLPMWSLIDYFNEIDEFRRTSRGRQSRESARDLLYIEEPEAHLFPSAQSLLMEFLIGSVIGNDKSRNLIITTHSPYIMSKLNVFLKAGQLGKKKRLANEVSEIVPRNCWIQENQISTFAIENRSLRNILDDDGLIDARYLDAVSEDISHQFSELLSIEANN